LKRLKQMTVQWKIFLFLLLFVALTLSVIWLSQVFLADKIHKAVKINDIESTAHRLSQIKDEDELKENAEAIAQNKQICLIIFKVNEREIHQIASSDVLRDCAIHRISINSKIKLYKNALVNGGEDLQRFRYDVHSGVYYSVSGDLFSKDSSVSGDESVIYTKVTESEDGYDTVMMLNSVISPLGTTVKAVNAQLTMVSAVLVIFSLAMAWMMSRGIARPIEKMNFKAKELGKGRYDVDFTSRGYREIAELGDTLNRTEKELEENDRIKRDLIANISHDLRTPLTMISGYAEIMRDIPGENSPENAQVIVDESKRLTTLINDVLDISRLERGKEPVSVNPFELTSSVSGMISRYNALIKHEGYKIEFDYTEEIDAVQDESKILKVIYNLINNAVTYTGDDRLVKVVQSRNGDKVRFDVSDSGEGIDPEKLKSIWERYYKVDKEHRRASVGSGLGLSIVKTVMDMIGGRYGVITSKGKGSTFWVEFDRINTAYKTE